MYEIVRDLPSTAWVLDLGSATGSFDSTRTLGRVVRVDLNYLPANHGLFVQSDAAYLPFADATFDAVVANHSLEHFERLNLAIGEIARVAKPNGSLFISVPDASTLSDRLYRWLGKGGGHVNAFTDSLELSGRVVDTTRMPLKGTCVLYSGFSFLNKHNEKNLPKRVWVLGGGQEWILRVGTYCLRILDRLFSTRLSVYGWAYYFGSVDALRLKPNGNVCIRCGSGHDAEWLKESGFLSRELFFWKQYRCPCCGTKNLFQSM